MIATLPDICAPFSRRTQYLTPCQNIVQAATGGQGGGTAGATRALRSAWALTSSGAPGRKPVVSVRNARRGAWRASRADRPTRGAGHLDAVALQDGSAARRSSVMRVGRWVALGLVSALGLLAGITPGHAAGYDAATDAYSMPNQLSNIGATAWWNAGYTGRGVDVALIDTGVSPVEGLSQPGRSSTGRICRSSRRPRISRISTRTVTARSWPG